MKHITFIPGWYWNLHGSGGGTFFREQAAVLRSRGWEVRLLYADLRPTYFPRAITQVDDDDGVPVLRYQNWSPPKLGRLTIRYWQGQYLRAFAQYRSQWGMPDLIHAHSYLGALAASAIKRKWGIPYVITEHLSRLTRVPEMLPQRIRQAIPLAYIPASGLYAVSSGLAKTMAHFSERPVDGIIPNLVNTDFFTPGGTALSAFGKEWTLCSIGDPWHRKGLDVLIEAVGRAQQRIAKPIRLRLAGRLPGRRQLNPIIRKWLLEDQVEFLGRLSKVQVRALLRESDACISASRYESFGITMIEALACGIPVIATRTAGGRQIMRDGKNGYLVEVGSPESLAEAIISLIDSKDSFALTNLRDPIVKQYSYSVVAKQIEAVYHTVLNPPC